MPKPKPKKNNVKLKAKFAVNLRVNVSAMLPYAPWLAWVVIVAYALLTHGHSYLHLHWLVQEPAPTR